MRISKNRWSILLILSVLLLGWTTAAAALEIRSGDIVNVPAGDISGPLFVSGNNLTVGANVNGDVFAAGSSITINGNVNGDVIAAGNSIAVNGTVSGDIRAAGNTVDIGGPVGGSITGAGNFITLREASRVTRDVMIFGNTVNLRGTIQGQAMGSANQFYLQGPVGSNINIWDVQNLIIGPAAAVNGSITYRSANPAQIDAAAKVGAINQLAPPVRPSTRMPDRVDYGISWTGTIIMVIASIIIWGIFYLIFPRLFPRPGHGGYGSLAAKLGWGFLTLLVVPLAIFVLFITIVGIPLALLLLFIYILALCLAKILVADYLVRVLAERNGWAGKGAVIASFIVILIILAAAARIPTVGIFISLIIASLALGFIVTGIARWRQPSTAPIESI
ncbi:MAG: polymer-forming cytoskeletal protein [Syntrophomonadaceae bacterium]